MVLYVVVLPASKHAETEQIGRYREPTDARPIIHEMLPRKNRRLPTTTHQSWSPVATSYASDLTTSRRALRHSELRFLALE